MGSMSNSTDDAPSSGLASAVIDALTPASSLSIGLALLLGFVVLLQRLLTTRLDPQEPPILRPKVPFIGHLIGLLRHQVDYFGILSGREPIATLPVLSGKIYSIWSPALIQSALRNRNLTFDVFGIEFAQRVFDLDDDAMKIIRGPGSVEESSSHEVMMAIKPAMNGQNLYRMNVRALSYVAGRLDATAADGLRVDNLYLWLRGLMTMATAEALYGSHNPLRNDESLIEALW
jgi:hypothetical protein